MTMTNGAAPTTGDPPMSPWLQDFRARLAATLDEETARQDTLRADLEASVLSTDRMRAALHEIDGRPEAPAPPARRSSRQVGPERVAQVRAYVMEHFSVEDDVTVAALGDVAPQGTARLALERLREEGLLRVYVLGGPGRARVWRLMPDAADHAAVALGAAA